MPGRDGTGPIGAGPITGRGLGFCTGAGFGFGCRRGFGRGYAINPTSSKTQKEVLNEQKIMLQNRLEAIDKQLENL